MVKTILFVCFLLFAVSGMCDFIYLVKMFFHSPKKRFKNYSLVSLEQGCAVSQLDFLWQKISWNGESFSCGIIALCNNLDKNEISDCKDYVKNKNITLCEEKNISEILNLRGEISND